MIKEYQNSMRKQVLNFLDYEKDQEWFKEFVEDPHYTKFVVLSEKKEIQGIIVIETPLGTAEINYIYVVENVRGKGAAKLLMDAAQSHAETKKCDGIRLNVTDSNELARRFYKKLGYKEVGAVKNYFSNGNTQVFYWKKL